MRKIVLENLRKLIAEIGAGVPQGVESKLESYWREIWEKKTDSSFPSEILEENQKLLTEVTVAVEAFLSERIDIDRVRKIIRRICEE
ncbi:MAG: hypothetical protein Q6352_009700 [Candidatus Freyrarchaeum guaymaensis]